GTGAAAQRLGQLSNDPSSFLHVSDTRDRIPTRRTTGDHFRGTGSISRPDHVATYRQRTIMYRTGHADAIYVAAGPNPSVSAAVMKISGFHAMTGNRQAQRAFDAGILSLGLSIDGQESTRDLEYAKLAFQRATEWDPSMCDAWLGRAAAGEVTDEVIANLHRTSTSTLHREQRRLGLPPRALA